MKSSSRQRRVLWRLAALCSIAVTSGCTLSNQEAPPLAGPSGFALSLEMTAAPQVLPRDGNSTSTVTVTARNADGTPKANQRLLLKPDFGTLTFTDALTGPNGTVSVVYTAPGMNVPVDIDTIRVTPVYAGDAANNTAFNGGSVRIQVVGPDIPEAKFTVSNPTPAVLEPVTFDASATKTKVGGGSACSTACSYIWDFGDGSNNIGATTNGMVIQHTYNGSGVFLVTLTVTSPAGTSSSLTQAVTVQAPTPPVASFIVTPASPNVNASAAYDGTASSVGTGASIVKYDWSFDDGDVGVSPIVLKTFTTVGTHVVSLTVTDSLGRVAAITKLVVVVP